MSCYHPLEVLYRVDADGKKVLYWPCKGQLEDVKAGKVVIDSKTGDVYRSILKLPCKKCIGCRLSYSSEWATRGYLEMKDYPPGQCWFFTLTYDDHHLAFPFSTDDRNLLSSSQKYGSCLRDLVHYDQETGEVLNQDTVCSLVPSHLTKFMKDFRECWRENFGVTGIRFMACGEYGEKNHRPHFHVIVFGCPFQEGLLKVYKNNFQGDVYYTCDLVDKIWKNGYCVIAENTWETIAYVSRYVMKKVMGLGKFIYEFEGVEPEFFRVSRNPGIARKYFDQNYGKIYDTDSIVIPGKNGAKNMSVPHYFDRLFGELYPAELDGIKVARREKAELRDAFIRKKTSIDEMEYLLVQENKLQNRLKPLVRDKV